MACAVGRDEDVCLYTGFFGGFGKIKVQVVVNLALGFDAADLCTCRTQTAEEDLGFLRRWELARPL